MNKQVGVIGIGGAGISIISYMVELDMIKDNYYVIDTKVAWLNASIIDLDRKIQIGIKETCGFGTNGNLEKGRKSVIENIAELKNLIIQFNVIIFVCGLGRGTGSTVLMLMSEIAQEYGIITISFCKTPFEFELIKNHETSKKLYKDVLESTNLLITFAFKRIVNEDRMNSFETADYLIAECINILLNSKMINKEQATRLFSSFVVNNSKVLRLGFKRIVINIEDKYGSEKLDYKFYG